MFFLNALSVDLILYRWALGVACVRTRACPIVRTVVCDLNTELNLVVGAGLRSKCGSAGSDWFAFCGCVYWPVVLALLRSSAYARGSGGWWLDSPSVVPRSRCCKSGIISTQAVYALEQLNAARLRLSYSLVRSRVRFHVFG